MIGAPRRENGQRIMTIALGKHPPSWLIAAGVVSQFVYQLGGEQDIAIPSIFALLDAQAHAVGWVHAANRAANSARANRCGWVCGTLVHGIGNDVRSRPSTVSNGSWHAEAA